MMSVMNDSAMVMMPLLISYDNVHTNDYDDGDNHNRYHIHTITMMIIPRTVVVHLQNALGAYLAVMRSLRFRIVAFLTL